MASCTKRRLRSGSATFSGGQDLDGDEAVQVGVAGLVDHAHAAFAELLEDLVVRERAAGLQVHSCRSIIAPGGTMANVPEAGSSPVL